MPRRAVGIVRVSQTRGREGESFASPAEQHDRLQAACTRDGITLIDVHEELDVSGGKPLEQREGLRQAVETIERRQAEVLAAAYFDRLFRSLTVQAEVVERVEKAGGQVLAVDVGQVSGGSAGQWLSGTMLGAVAEYHRRSTRERTREAQRRAVARGVAPYAHIPLGYVKGADGVYVPDPATSVTVREAFERRARGDTVAAVREFLRDRGIRRSYAAVEQMLRSRVYLGEIHFGSLVNIVAHEPLVDRDVWTTVHRMVIPSGRKAKSERLLARLGVLRCGSCGARMVVGTARQGGKRYPYYRCPPVGDCPQRVTISAPLVEGVVVAAVRRRLADVEGRASAERNVHDAQVTLDRAQSDLDAAIRAFAGLEDEDAARTRLAELRDARDEARERVEHLGSPRLVMTVNLSRDWDLLTLEERRAAIRLTVAAVRVAPGRGAGRVKVEMLGYQAAGD
jgi:site-specific DNA recombinase